MYRDGQWVKFPAEGPMFEGAHHDAAGWNVGIYQKAGVDRLTGAATPEAVVVVGPDGSDHLFEGRPVRLKPECFALCRPADPLMDAPLDRVKHLLSPDGLVARLVAYGETPAGIIA